MAAQQGSFVGKERLLKTTDNCLSCWTKWCDVLVVLNAIADPFDMTPEIPPVGWRTLMAAARGSFVGKGLSW